MSHNEFLAQVDSVLATNQANSARLKEILSEEHTKVPLPPEVYAEVERRIEHLAEVGDEETRVQTTAGGRLSMPLASLASGGFSQADAASDAMKGVGDTLNGRFVLEECLGFGGMGMVFKALDLRKMEASDRNPYIAIKVLNVQFRGHPKSLIALQREAKKAQKLAHPNIVTVYDFDRDGAMVYLTMEYLSGQPLSRTLRTQDFKGMPCAKALPIITGMAKALAYAHERGFVHCDLKPANVFLTDAGEVKVIDFGISRVFQKPDEEVEATIFDPGTLGGMTPAYASPEMLEHREPDPRDDIYALACISYELLTGRHPFERLTATQAKTAGSKLRRPAKLPRRQWRALKEALSFDRETRTPSVERFLQEMRGERRPGVQVALVMAGTAAAVLLAVALGYLWESRPGRRGEQEVPAAPVPEAAQPATQPLSLASVAPILAGVPCAALAASASDHTLQVQGYLSRDFGVRRLKDMLKSVPGVQTVNVDVQQVNDDKCGVISLFAPYWTLNRQAGGGASIHTRAANGELKEGDPLVVDITTPAYDSWVNVDYFALDGSVAHLVPNTRSRDNQAPPNYTAAIGSLGDWVIGKPFGSEMIVLLVTPAPLFEGVRAEYESRAEYLRAVEERLGKMAEKYGRDRIAVDFAQINTRAR